MLLSVTVGPKNNSASVTTTLKLVVVPACEYTSWNLMKDQPLSVPDFEALADFLIVHHMTTDEHRKLPTEHKTG